MVGDGREAVPNQKAGDGQSDKDTDNGHDGDPFLFGIPLVKPRLLNVASLDPARVKVALGVVADAVAYRAGRPVARSRARHLRTGKGIGAGCRTVRGSCIDAVVEIIAASLINWADGVQSCVGTRGSRSDAVLRRGLLLHDG